MNAIDKLRSLQAGELDKVLPDIYVGTPWSKTLYPICKIHAAKVEVTKVVLDEIEARLSAIKLAIEAAWGDEPPMPCTIEAKHDCRKALTLLQQLKESL
jgi:hypothetical protein